MIVFIILGLLLALFLCASCFILALYRANKELYLAYVSSGEMFDRCMEIIGGYKKIIGEIAITKSNLQELKDRMEDLK